MRIGQRDIGSGHPPYIIAELGVNHDGSVDRALELTRAAHDAGADAIKLQLFRTDMLMSKAAKLAAYQKVAGETDPVAMLRRLELPIDQMRPVVALAHDLGLHAIVTVFSVELVPEAETLPWDAYKTASPDVINKPLLDALAATGRPLIVSTGASTIDEVQRAVQWLHPVHDRLALLQCVSSYPTPADMDELGGIKALKEIFVGPIGYSDHTPGIETGWMAVAAGACILEKHFTYNRKARGPDHAASLEGPAFRQYRDGARLRQMQLQGVDYYTPYGEAPPPLSAVVPVVPRVRKTILDIERDVRTVSRQSLTTTRPLPRGHTLARPDLTIKRPGTGLEPFRLEESLGRALTRDVEADVPLAPNDLQ